MLTQLFDRDTLRKPYAGISNNSVVIALRHDSTELNTKPAGLRTKQGYKLNWIDFKKQSTEKNQSLSSHQPKTQERIELTPAEHQEDEVLRRFFRTTHCAGCVASALATSSMLA